VPVPVPGRAQVPEQAPANRRVRDWGSALVKVPERDPVTVQAPEQERSWAVQQPPVYRP
jgi:hypothetical protein